MSWVCPQCGFVIEKPDWIEPCPKCGAVCNPRRGDAVHHPIHYGGADNPYEAIKVIDAWQLGFNLGNTIKYISRASKKGTRLEDLKKAAWYLNHEIETLTKDGGA